MSDLSIKISSFPRLLMDANALVFGSFAHFPREQYVVNDELYQLHV